MSPSLSTKALRNFVIRGGRKPPFTLLGFGSAPLGNYLRPLSEKDCDAPLEAAISSLA